MANYFIYDRESEELIDILTNHSPEQAKQYEENNPSEYLVETDEDFEDFEDDDFEYEEDEDFEDED